MSIFSSLQMVLISGAVIINLLLAFLVYKSERRSATNIIFVVLTVFISIWLIILYLAKDPNFAKYNLWMIRLSTFIAAPMSLMFFLLAHTLPSPILLLKKKTLTLLLIITGAVMLLNISPYTFVSLQISKKGANPIPGPGIIPFGILTTLFSLTAVFLLIKKFKKTTGEQKQQFRLIMLGILLMLGLIIISIFIPVVLFHIDTFVPFSPLYTLIFLGFTAYSIVKLKLFNIKIITTQALTVLLWIMLFSKIVVSPSISQRIVDIFIFSASVIFGRLLIKSIKKEVRQREELQKLTEELAEANQKLKALDMARAEFISIASHQLRTPPATVKWYLSSIISGDYGPLDAKVKETLIKTERTNNLLISLIEDMLNVSRIERGKLEFLFEPANIEEMARMTFEQFEPIALEKEQKLAFRAPKKNLPSLMADKEKLRQVINNLIDNAIKYTPRGGNIKISLKQSAGQIEFSVSDDGRGIAPEDINILFDKYTRGKESFKHSAGLGLGLYVAKIIIDQHKGKIWAESPGEGKGSVFTFTLPIVNNLTETTLVDLAANQNMQK